MGIRYHSGMALKIGIVGLPNVGKSTLFNALTRTRGAQAANYPFCTIDPNVGVVEVPDPRLQKLVDIVHPAKVIPATVEFVDIAGLVKGAHKGEGLGNKFLHHIREVHAICHVLRGFEDGNIQHVEGSVDAKRDREIVEIELELADLEMEERQKKGKNVRLGEGISILPFLRKKPVIYAVNVSEGQLKTMSTEGAREITGLPGGASIVVICAKLEEDLQDLSPEEGKTFLKELGVESSGLDRLIRAAYNLLGYITFFTAGPKEAHAWNLVQGMRAPGAAGVIHTDFERGFIRAEIIAYDDYVKYGGEQGAKEAGRLRIEGKEYVMQDGDIAHFRFNV